MMFVSTPRLYYFNWAFELKMLLFLAAILVQLLAVSARGGDRVALACTGTHGRRASH